MGRTPDDGGGSPAEACLGGRTRAVLIEMEHRMREFTEVLRYANHVPPPQPQREQAPHDGHDARLRFPSVAHVTLTVTDLSRSVCWYQRLIGAPPVPHQDTGTFRQVVF